ncbi:hypothetical protein HMPREF1544_02332 [Mucor circinelloides 1006PhL]|uniref:Ubiquitin-like domain-containing protein n=1 Tax=Mucor circinelloides f. circinelloides (strain 1006PhL) TaxID=1220926 RepID=S2JLC1_MUCC1|nr:hypothetical protein HMPREF1544_02332 [Mucor circinelloides 1006PhL]
MQITVQKPTGKQITLDVDSSESVQSVKQKIQSKEGIAKDQQRLFYQDTPLQQGGRSLQDYAIRTNSLLQLKIDLKIYLQLINSEIYTFIIDPAEKMSVLKQKIQDKLNIPVEKQHIIHRGIDVSGDFPLSNYMYDENTYNTIIKLRGY